jgi:hypothetical protein
VNEWAVVFLGIIAVATLLTAVVQVGVLVAASRLARRLEALAERLEHDLKPVVGHLETIGRDAARAAALATAQVERADRLFADVSRRVEQTLDGAQSALAGPAREGAAVLAGIRAALAALRDIRSGSSRQRSEEEDALFI